MSHKKQGNLDANHTVICNRWRELHLSVADTSGQGGFVDAVIAKVNGETAVVEIKTETGYFTATQLEFLAGWKGYAAFVTSTEEAERLALNIPANSFNPRDCQKILNLCARKRLDSKIKNPHIFVKEIKEILGA